MPHRAIKAIFFTRFHHEKGSRVLHQVPEGSITPSASSCALRNPLFTFSSVTSYLIPNQQFCDRLLTFCTNHYRVIGYPVCIREGKYSRNEYIFNLALVVEESLSDWVGYGEVVRKLGRLLRGLEEQGGFLSEEEVGMSVWDDEGSYFGDGWRFGMDGGHGSKVHALCENVLEDLNNYAECMIPIDDSNTINLKLFPTRPPPPPIHAHTVPLLTISLSKLSRPLSSDLTLTRILPYINGINSVSHIAQLADADLSLTRKAIQHLVYYGCLVLLDVFSFGVVYAPTAEIGGFIVDEAVGEECGRYVKTLGFGRGSVSTGVRDHDDRMSVSSAASQHSETFSSASGSGTHATATVDGHISDEDVPNIPHDTLIALYTSLRQGLTLRNWVLENLSLLSGIDVRRFITFGIIKGFLYRVHKYAIATSISLPPAPPTSLQSAVPSTAPSSTGYKESDQSTIRGHPHSQHIHHKPSFASTTVFGPGIGTEKRMDDVAKLDEVFEIEGRDKALPLIKFLDGMHCFDEICTELGMSEKVVEAKVRAMGEVQIFSK
ncbi:nitrogen permease regulator 2 [Massarina eburnea CBS 473.64]|uniref:Nitrogen permease regulator 2 n=1 Tax=Massarina eburnea CBS 473.64 TaxID=1395130 RepID=A0A6A6RQD1_9PLEO|nr:nitrogen permease regulator 2 [Massarina eburnea CBS 473.64]